MTNNIHELGADNMARRSKQEIKRTAWHKAAHVVHRLGAMEDVHRLIAPKRPSFIGVWIKRDEGDKAPASHRGMEQTSNGLMLQDETEYVYTHKGMMVSNLLAGIAGERLMTKRVMGASTRTLIIESIVAGVFVLFAVLGFKGNYWLVVAALLGHGVFDFVRHFFIDNPVFRNGGPVFAWHLM